MMCESISSPFLCGVPFAVPLDVPFDVPLRGDGVVLPLTFSLSELRRVFGVDTLNASKRFVRSTGVPPFSLLPRLGERYAAP